MRRRYWVMIVLLTVVALTAWITVVSDSATTQGTSDTRSDRGPIEPPPPHAYVDIMPMGSEFTDGLDVLDLKGAEPAKIEDVRITGNGGFQFLGAKLIGPNIGGTVQEGRSWPPRPEDFHGADFIEAKGAVLQPGTSGYELLIGMRVTGTSPSVRRTIEIDYMVGSRKYTVTLPAEIDVCTSKRQYQQGRCDPSSI